MNSKNFGEITITAIPMGRNGSMKLDALSLLNPFVTLERACDVPEIIDVIFNEPATVVFWEDGTKTIVKCQKGDSYSKETGLAMAIIKKLYGNKGRYNDIFNKWIKED